MLSAFVNSFKIPELRQKILFTLSMLFVARIGANIPLPGLDPTPLGEFFKDQQAAGNASLLGLYNMFTGGALLKGAIFGLGIMPYISASIILQIMQTVVPGLARLAQEGDTGRRKISQYTRYATVVICFIQGVLMVSALQHPTNLFPGFDTGTYGPIVIASGTFFLVSSTIILTAGTLILMWLGEQITERGIGQGVSILITIGIVSDFPAAIAQVVRQLKWLAPVGVTENLYGLPEIVMMILLLFVVTAFVVMVSQGVRKIPVQHAKRVVGRKVYGGQSSHMPLKVNYSGVMPVIFASAILMFPQQLFSTLGARFEALQFLGNFAVWFQRGTFSYYTIFGLLILVFSYFWVSMMFKPIQIADDLKKYGGYIPGVRPGEPTAQFLDFVMTRLTLAGAVFLTAIALFPDILLYWLNTPFQVASFFGGTGMLITVGVTLDTLGKVETHLLQRHYDGFMKKGRIRGRNPQRHRQTVAAGDLASMKPLFITLSVIFILGIVSAILRNNVL